MNRRIILAGALALASLYGAANAAEITLINKDPAGKGLNDPTPLAPAGGNPGTTVGEQRRIVYQFATDLWGAVLQSTVPIRVEASFAALKCDPVSGRAVLGQAGATGSYTTTKGLAGVRYQSALADAIDGSDHDSSRADITSQFNASYGLTNPDGSACNTGKGWYYGLNGHAPSDQVDFLNVVMHEIAHGLGFAGNELLADDIYSSLAYDLTLDKKWSDLGLLKRITARADQNVVFTGKHVQEEVPLVLGERVMLRLSGKVQRDIVRFGMADFGGKVADGSFTAPLAVVDDGTGDKADACEPLAAGSLVGKVAFINRGSCDYVVKVDHAQSAGAVAAIIGNVATSPQPDVAPSPGLSDEYPNLKPAIFTIGLALKDADAIRASATGNTAQIVGVPGRYEGADDANHPYLYAPALYESGSSFSHFDTLLSPNAVMEPFSNSDEVAHVDLDLTPAAFADEGWVLNPGNGLIGTCDTGIKAVEKGGIVLGANVQAFARSCLREAEGSRARYLRCMTDHATMLRDAKLITNQQLATVRSCAATISP